MLRLLLLAFLFFSLLVKNTDAQMVSEKYVWNNVSIGGGGYILGVYIHPKNSKLIYIRTDVGGAYRYDDIEERMIAMFDWIPYEQSNLYGINGLALDPENENIVYAACGKYPAQTPSAVYKSEDYGKSWTSLGLTVPFSGNAHPNRQGHLIMVNPLNTQEVFCGSTGKGLWKYNGTQWTQVSGIPANSVVRTIEFDPTHPQNMYVAVTYSINWGVQSGSKETAGVYRSTNGGVSFEKIPKLPSSFIQFSELSCSKEGDILFVSCLEHDGSQGAILKLSQPATDSSWLNITPQAGPFRTVSASPYDNQTVITALGNYGSLSKFYVSLNGGQSWSTLSSYQVQNIIPWHPSSYPGSAISSIEFDPVNPTKIYFSDWYSVYSTENWTANPVIWNNSIARGHEEVVPAIVVGAHPDNAAGAKLYFGGADVSGITQLSLLQYSSIPNWRTQVGSDYLQEVSGIDYSCSFPSRIVTIGGKGWPMSEGGVAISDDGGKTFSLVDGFESAWGGGRVAVSAKNKDGFIVLTNTGGMKYTINGGKNFYACTGTSGKYGIGDIFNTVHPIAADRINGKYYLYDKSSGNFLVSTDNGMSFSKQATVIATSSSYINVITIPGKENHIWITLGSSGLWHSTDGGSNWTKSNNFGVANLIAVGKAAPGSNYPTLYVWAKKTGESSMKFFRSTNAGASFELINEETQAGDIPMCMGADQHTFGRFYVATNGRGIYSAGIEGMNTVPDQGSERGNTSRFSISPNPCKDYLSIYSSRPSFSYTISNSAGSCLIPETRSFHENTTVLVNHLKKGLYLVSLKDGFGTEQLKFLKL